MGLHAAFGYLGLFSKMFTPAGVEDWGVGLRTARRYAVPIDHLDTRKCMLNGSSAEISNVV
jgi:hypothetical protein